MKPIAAQIVGGMIASTIHAQVPMRLHVTKAEGRER